MTREDIKQRYADIKAKLKAAQTLLDSLNDVDEDDLQGFIRKRPIWWPS